VSLYRGTGGATSVSGDATVEQVLQYSTDAQAAAAAASASQSAASSSASAASTSASNASTSETNAAASESAASAAQTAAEAAQTAAELAETNAETAETNATAQVALAAAQVTLAEAEVANAATEVTYAEEWANKAEDSLVSVAAGGDGSTEYSAKHWAAKAADIVAAGVIDDTQTSTVLTWSSSKIEDYTDGTTAIAPKTTQLKETYATFTSTSNASTIDCSTGTVFSHTLTENTTVTFSNPPATGTAYGMTVKIVQDAGASGYTVTWPTSVDWAAATAPTLTATASAVDVFVFYTHDAGNTWYGFTSGQAMA